MSVPSIFGENTLDEFFRDPFSDDRDMKKLEEKIYGRRGEDLTKTNTREADTEYELEMDLLGFKKGEIKVFLKDGYLIICAAKGLDKDEQEKNSGGYVRQERYTGARKRSFYVSGDVADESIKDEPKHGILGLSIPKKDAKSLIEEKKYIFVEG